MTEYITIKGVDNIIHLVPLHFIMKDMSKPSVFF